MTYRKHETSPVVAARDAIRLAVEETQLARLAEERRKRRRRIYSACGFALALALSGVGLWWTGYSLLWIFAVLAFVSPVALFFWLGSGLEPHGENPPLRHG